MPPKPLIGTEAEMPTRSAEPPPGMLLPADYPDWLASLKNRIQGARMRALLAANDEQLRLYHDIG